MIYKKELLILVGIVLSSNANFSPISYDVVVDANVPPVTVNRFVRRADPVQVFKLTEMMKQLDMGKLFKNLRHNRSPDEVRIVTTLGLVSGALKLEESMRENLYYLTDELMDSFNKSTPRENLKKLITIEESITRDKSAVAVLNGMLKYARNETSLDDFQRSLQRILHENEIATKRLRSKKSAIHKHEIDGRKSASTGKLMNRSGTNLKYSIKERLYDVKEMIDNHVENVHTSVTENVKQTIKYVQKKQKTSQRMMKPQSKRHHTPKLDPSLNAVRRLWDQVASGETPSSEFEVTLSYKNKRPKLEKKSSTSESPRLTKGEQVDSKSDKEVILVDTKLDRLRRQGKKEAFTVDVDFGDDNEAKKREDSEDDIENNEVGSDKNTSSQGEKSNQEEEFDESSSESEGPGGLVGLITNLSGGDEGSDIGAVLGALSQVISNLLGPGGIDVPGLVSSGSALIASLLAGDENFGKVLGDIVGLMIDGFSGGGGAANNGQFFGQFMGKLISSLSADPDDDDAPLQPDTFIKNLYDGIGKGSANAAEREGDGDGQEANCDDGGGSDSSSFIKGVISGLLHVITKASMDSSAGSAQGSAQASTGSSGGSSHGSSGSKE